MEKAIELFRLVVGNVERFLRTLVAKIVTDQLISAVSYISTNIAEGFGRKSSKEFSYHLGIAKGEASESQDWYIKCEKVNFLDKNTMRERIALLDEIIKMLNALISKVTSRS